MESSTPTLLCWHSHRAGAEVLEKALKGLSNRRIEIRRVLYLLQEDKLSVLPQIEGVQSEVIRVSLEDPTHHHRIYEVMKTLVLPRVRDLKALHINISPGTPAMHSVWLILHAGGAFPAGTRLWSSQYNRETNRTRIDPVDFPVTTYLSQLRERFAEEERAGIAVYDPESKSQSRREALERLARYARVPGAPLLLLGERGVGKTRVVETLVSTMKDRPKVVTVPCGGLDSSLVESVLFGYVKGSFTGATEDRPGLLEEADKGILFLDEVQDLPRHAQRRLIRLLQDRERRYRPLGSQKELRADVEIVCASNHPLDSLRQTLDQDFFDRISHLVVSLPPLRDCRGDIREDWQRVWMELRLADDLPQQALWSKAMEEAFEKSHLPGNLRDLQRFASLLMAWLPGLPADQAINKAIEEWLSGFAKTPSTQSDMGSGTRQERLYWFRRELALWAKTRFGTWVNAAEELDCTEKTLRSDAKREINRES